MNIVGTVAAMTLPTVIKDFQKQTSLARLKKSYTILANANYSAIAEHGDMSTWELSSITDFVKIYVLPYLKVAHDCGTTTTGGCAFKAAYLNAPDSFEVRDSTWYRFYLADGTLVSMIVYEDDETHKRVIVNVDVNGTNGPNVFGRDIFEFYYILLWSGSLRGIVQEKFMPSHFEGTKEQIDSNCSKSGAGTYCAAKIMKASWQMESDYPW